VEQIQEAAFSKALGADELLAARADPGDDQRTLAERERLAHGVVAAHGHEAARPFHQVARLVYKIEDGQAPITPRPLMEVAPAIGLHLRAEKHDPLNPGRRAGAREDLGQLEPVLSTADHAQRKRAVGDAVGRGRLPAG
jgi:hypothetical protein